MVLLVILSSFTVLPNIPARIILHIICAGLSLVSGLVMMKVYSDRYKRDSAPYQYDWRQDVQVRGPTDPGAGTVNKMDLSRESNVL